MILEVAALLKGVKGLTFTISREDGSEERLQVLVTSSLGDAPKDGSDEIEQMRSVLAMPLLMRGTAAEIDAALPNLLERAGAVRASVADQIDGCVVALEKAAADAVAKNKAKAEDAARKKAETAKKKVDDAKDAPKVAAKAPGKPGPKPKVEDALKGVSATAEIGEVPNAQTQSMLFGEGAATPATAPTAEVSEESAS